MQKVHRRPTWLARIFNFLPVTAMNPKCVVVAQSALGMYLWSALAVSAQAQLERAGDLLVDLNFTTLTPGDLPYIANAGKMGGGFEALGPASSIPAVRATPQSGVKALYLDGGDFLMSVAGQTPLGGTPVRLRAAAGLVGAQPSRSVEAWVYNEAVPDEETVLAWGKRGGGDGSNYSCLYGGHPAWGALGQWGGPDLGWAGAVPPEVGTWHHLAWVHTGADVEGGGADPNQTLVYVDGALNNSENAGVLTTHVGPMLIGAQMTGDGVNPEAANRGTLRLAKVRVHDGALTAGQVANNYALEVGAFPATVAAPLAAGSGPVHRWSFADGAGSAVRDSAGYLHGKVKGANSSWTGSSLSLPGGGSGTEAYVDLPNRLLSSNAKELGGTGEVSLEMWVTATGNRTWSRFFDFGSTSGNEITGPGGAGEGWDYLFLSAQEGNNTARNVFSLRHNDRFGNGPLGAGGTLNVNPAFGYDTASFGTERHIVVVWKDQEFLGLYEEGQLVRELRPGDIKMVQMNDVNCWLGRSTWLADQNLQGDLNEFRIYDRALSAGEILQNRADGPDGSLPLPPDGDGDGLPNWFERRYAGASVDPSVPGQGGLDGDGDGRSNLQEFQGGTNPSLADSDADGLSDGQESARGTDPLAADSDGDSLSDGAEVLTHLTNPLAADSDGDGYRDAQEVGAGSNPNDAKSIPVIFLAGRYSFTGPEGAAAEGAAVLDSVSGQRGYVRGAGASWTQGGLALPGGASREAPYVDLPNGMVSRFARAQGGRGTVTLEGWVTINANAEAGWQRILDFGSSAPGKRLGETFGPGRSWAGYDAGQDYLMIAGARGNDVNARRVDWTNNDATGAAGNNMGTDSAASEGTVETPLHFVLTYDESIGKLRYFENGSLISETSGNLKLDSLNDVNCWLGRSNWLGDRNLSGTFDEFRVYAGAFSDADVTKSFAKGPNTLPNGSNPATDITTLKIANANGWPEWWIDRNPSLPPSGSDLDGDGLTALQELGRGSDPSKADSDGDGLSDAAENNSAVFASAASPGTSPSDPDTDHDGLADAAEVAAGSDPFDVDSDGDLALDGADGAPLSAEPVALWPAHRWTFNDLPDGAIANGAVSQDSAGGAGFAAVIRGEGATAVRGEVVLPGGPNNETSPWIDLPNHLISTQKRVTLTGWFAVNGYSGNWSRFVDFGDSAGQEVPPAGIAGGTDYLVYSVQMGGDGGLQRFGLKDDPTESVYDFTFPTVLGQEIFISITVDSSPGNCSLYTVYRDGVFQCEVAGGQYALSSINDVNNWLGRSQYAGDSTLNGQFQEFRIYNGALNAKAIKRLYANGPDNNFVVTGSQVVGRDLEITWNSRVNLTYTLESSPDLAVWTAAQANVPAAGTSTSASVPLGSGPLFYRVRLDE